MGKGTMKTDTTPTTKNNMLKNVEVLRAQIIGLYYMLPPNGEPYDRMGLGIRAANALRKDIEGLND